MNEISKKQFRILVHENGPAFAVNFVFENHPELLSGFQDITDLSLYEWYEVHISVQSANELRKIAFERLNSMRGTFDQWHQLAKGEKRVLGAKWQPGEIKKLVVGRMYSSAQTFEQYRTFVEYANVSTRRYMGEANLFDGEKRGALDMMAKLAKSFEQWKMLDQYLSPYEDKRALNGMLRSAKTLEEWTKTYSEIPWGFPERGKAIEGIAKFVSDYKGWSELVRGTYTMGDDLQLEEYALQSMAELAGTFSEHLNVLRKLHFYELAERYASLIDRALQSMVELTKDEEFDKWVTIYRCTKEGSDLDNLAFEKISLFPSNEFHDWHSLVDRFGGYTPASRLGKLAVEKAIELAKSSWDWKRIYEIVGLDPETKKLVAEKMVQAPVPA